MNGLTCHRVSAAQRRIAPSMEQILPRPKGCPPAYMLLVQFEALMAASSSSCAMFSIGLVMSRAKNAVFVT